MNKMPDNDMGGPDVQQTLKQGLRLMPVNTAAVERAVGYVRGAAVHASSNSSFRLFLFSASPIRYAMAAMVVCAIGLSFYVLRTSAPNRAEIGHVTVAASAQASLLIIPDSPAIRRIRDDILEYTATVSRLLSREKIVSQESDLDPIIQKLATMVENLDAEISGSPDSLASKERGLFQEELRDIKSQLALLSSNIPRSAQ